MEATLQASGACWRSSTKSSPSRPSQVHRPWVSKSHLCICVLALSHCQGQASVPHSQCMLSSFIYSSIHLLPDHHCVRDYRYQSNQHRYGFGSQSICSKKGTQLNSVFQKMATEVKPRIYRGPKLA